MRYALMIGVLCALAFVPSCFNLGLMSREDIVKSIPPLLTLEQRKSSLGKRVSILGSAGLMEEEDLAKVKAHSDVYFVYYLAANVSLARGDIQDYLLNVEFARIELDSIEEIVGAVIIVTPGEQSSGDPT